MPGHICKKKDNLIYCNYKREQLMEELIKMQLKSTLIEYLGEGMNCICEGEDSTSCVCGADWDSREVKFFKRKLDIAINALIDANNDIERISKHLSDNSIKELNVENIIERNDSIADQLEDDENSLDKLSI